MHEKVILVVDDDKAICEMVGAVLFASGYDVEFALDGEEALEKVAEVRPDLILMDIFMPLLSGRDVADRIRENAGTKRVPILAMSGMPEFGSGAARKDLKADDFIHKPLLKKELLSKVGALLERR